MSFFKSEKHMLFVRSIKKQINAYLNIFDLKKGGPLLIMRTGLMLLNWVKIGLLY